MLFVGVLQGNFDGFLPVRATARGDPLKELVETTRIRLPRRHLQRTRVTSQNQLTMSVTACDASRQVGCDIESQRPFKT
jgi:hypothetical protein